MRELCLAKLPSLSSRLNFDSVNGPQPQGIDFNRLIDDGVIEFVPEAAIEVAMRAFGEYAIDPSGPDDYLSVKEVDERF